LVLLVDESKCVGCKTCAIVCSYLKFKVFNPKKARIKIEERDLFFHKPVICRFCKKPPCLEACPNNAIIWKNGILVIDQEKCTGCGMCIDACPFGAIWLEDGKAVKCDLCGGSPKCVELCPTGAIRWVD